MSLFTEVGATVQSGTEQHICSKKRDSALFCAVHADLVYSTYVLYIASNVIVAGPADSTGNGCLCEGPGRGLMLWALLRADVKNRRGNTARGRKITGMQFLPQDPSQLLITSNDSRVRLYEGKPPTPCCQASKRPSQQSG